MNNGTYLSREQILGAQDLGSEDVPVPEWGGVVRVRALSAHDRDAFRRAAGGEDMIVKLAAMLIVDGGGNRVFSDVDIQALAAKSEAPLIRINQVGLRLSGLGEQAVEQAEKNSAPGPSADSRSN
jgi:hypothetical protein